MHWSFYKQIGRRVFQSGGYFQTFVVKFTPQKVEKIRKTHFPDADILIGRIKAVRFLDPNCSLKNAKLWIEVRFDEKGRGKIKDWRKK